MFDSCFNSLERDIMIGTENFCNLRRKRVPIMRVTFWRNHVSRFTENTVIIDLKSRNHFG